MSTLSELKLNLTAAVNNGDKYAVFQAAQECIAALEAENDAIGKALMDFRPFRYQNMSNLEAVLDLIRDDEAQS